MGEEEEEEGAGQSDPREARARGAEEGGGERGGAGLHKIIQYEHAYSCGQTVL